MRREDSLTLPGGNSSHRRRRKQLQQGEEDWLGRKKGVGGKVLEEEDREEQLCIVPRVFALQRSDGRRHTQARQELPPLASFFFFCANATSLPVLFRRATATRNVVNSGFLYPLPVVQDEV